MVIKAPTVSWGPAHLRETGNGGGNLNFGLSPCQLRNDYMQRYASKVSEGMALQLGCLELRYVASRPLQSGCLHLPSCTGHLASLDFLLQRGKQEWVCESWKGTRCGRQRVSPRGAQHLVLGREMPAPSLVGAPYLPLAAIQVIQ